MSNKDILRELKSMVKAGEIDNRDLNVMTMRMAGLTLTAVGQHHGITRERIRQVQNVVLYKLRDTGRDELWLAVGEAIKRKTDDCVGQYKLEKREIRALLKDGFDYKRLMEISGATGHPTEQELCEIIYRIYHIARFYKYMRCHACATVKTKGDYSANNWATGANLCRKCNTIRTIQYYQDHIANDPERRRRMYIRNRDKMKIYMQRYWLKKQGREDEMPPLPPTLKSLYAHGR